ncbi:3-oxoacid CoA-transferase subunit B [Myxococcota bacterium]|nr:3-oxoacid CoA-transferase subunit B [Myxococcota bacterium]MBU1382791.1 3-oxoacid CoA-transferase subunit B [Myxococcota bacterium]MBU1495937.1 3-oxoacid CoA-transferase subunit B [Myxococcota bacterium]
MEKDNKRDMISRRIAAELKDGDYCNLGIGLPTGVANHIPPGITVYFQSENGILGAGPKPEPGMEEADLINAGGGPITAIPGASYFDSFWSFSMIRGGHVDMTVLGALQVDQEGSIANWMIPGKVVPGIGGAMDLVSGAKQVVAAMEHMDKYGNSKIMKKCNLPLTGYRVLTLIVTDMAAMRITPEGLLLVDLAEGVSLDDVIKATDADLIIPDNVGTFN